MQKWEYLFVVPDEESNKVHYVNGKELSNWKTGPDLYSYLNTLGSQGWELVAVPYTEIGYSYGHTNTAYYRDLTRRFVFKRPLP